MSTAATIQCKHRHPLGACRRCAREPAEPDEPLAAWWNRIRAQVLA